MKRESVFLVYCELSADSEPLKAEGYAGAFVTCFVPTDNIVEAISLSDSALTQDGYILTDIGKVIRFEPDDWHHDPKATDLAGEVSSSTELRYSDFEVWGH